MRSSANWWPQVTLRDLVSWPVVAFSTAGGMIIYLAGLPTSLVSHSLAAIAVGLGAMAVFFASLGVIALGLTLLRLPRDSVVLMLGAVVTAATVRGGTIWLIHGVVYTDDPLSLGVRTIASVLSIVPLGISSAAVWVAFRNYRQAQHDTTELQAALQAIDEHASQHIEAFSRDTVNRAHLGINEAASALREAGRGENTSHALEVIRRVSNDVVTPLSTSVRLPRHRVPQPKPQVGPIRIRWRELWQSAIEGRPHWPIVTGGLAGIAVSPQMMESLSASVGMAVSALWAGVIAGVIWVQNHFLALPAAPQRPGLRSVVLVLLAGAGVVGLLGVVDVLESVLSLPGSTRIFLTNVALTIPASMALVVIARGLVLNIRRALRQRDDLQAEFDHLMTKANDVFWQHRSALSHALHGPVQAALNAAELRSRSAMDTGHFTPELAEELATELEQTVDSLSVVGQPHTDVTLALERIRHTWEGLCEVTWDASTNLLEQLSRSTVSASVAEIVVEAAFNAVRHASAQRVHIAFEILPTKDRDPLLGLKVSNDGTPPQASTSPGQGSELFDLLSQRWSLTELTEQEPMTSELRLELSLPGNIENAS